MAKLVAKLLLLLSPFFAGAVSGADPATYQCLRCFALEGDKTALRLREDQYEVCSTVYELPAYENCITDPYCTLLCLESYLTIYGESCVSAAKADWQCAAYYRLNVMGPGHCTDCCIDDIYRKSKAVGKCVNDRKTRSSICNGIFWPPTSLLLPDLDQNVSVLPRLPFLPQIIDMLKAFDALLRAEKTADEIKKLLDLMQNAVEEELAGMRNRLTALLAKARGAAVAAAEATRRAMTIELQDTDRQVRDAARAAAQAVDEFERAMRLAQEAEDANSPDAEQLREAANEAKRQQQEAELDFLSALRVQKRAKSAGQAAEAAEKIAIEAAECLQLAQEEAERAYGE